MARSVISNPKKLRKLSALIGHPILFGFSRGNNNHWWHLFCTDGTAWFMHADTKEFEQDTDPPVGAGTNSGLEWLRG
jgi:hypothetical protein